MLERCCNAIIENLGDCVTDRSGRSPPQPAMPWSLPKETDDNFASSPAGVLRMLRGGCCALQQAVMCAQLRQTGRPLRSCFQIKS